MNAKNPPRPAAHSVPKGSPLPPPVDPLLARRTTPTRPAASPGTRPTIPAARTAARPTSTASSPATATASPQPPVRKPVVGRRAKPARAAKMVSLGLSAVSTVAMAGLFARHDVSADDGSSIVIATPATTGTAGTTATTVSTTASTTGSAGSTTGTPATTATTVASTTAAATGSILAGTYVGSASQNRWGVVQVQAVYSGGQLIDVQILQYPNGDNRSISINQRALPTLINAAIAAQSAGVSNISGATYTSRSYVASLQSAIDNAKAASGIAG